ncbi:MAG: hypothetical protein SEPTF4163_005433 [Sporothrix epigloea]
MSGIKLVEEPHDYITDVNERQRLFSKIRPLIAQTVSVSSTVLAIFMVYPLSELRSLAERLAEFDTNSDEDLKRPCQIDQEHRLKVTLQGESDFARETSPGTPLSPLEKTGSNETSPVTHSRNAVRKAKDRDNHTCILTGADNPEAAHIYPLSAGPASGRKKYITMLVSFWGKEKADAWSRQYWATSVTESPKNLLCLSCQLHFWWSTCRLALRPIRTLDPCTIKLQLHWLRHACTRPTAPLSGTFDDIRLLCGGEDGLKTWGPQPLAHRKSGLPLLESAASSSHIGAAEAEDAPWEEGADDDEYGGHYALSNVYDDDVEELDL